MPEMIESPSRVEAAGTKPKLIDEYVGRVNSGEERVSVAHMRSPAGWLEPGQRPDFDEYTRRPARAASTSSTRAGARRPRRPGGARPRGEWVRYSTPGDGGASYVAVCLPAFSPDTVHRDDG